LHELRTLPRINGEHANALGIPWGIYRAVGGGVTHSLEQCFSGNVIVTRSPLSVVTPSVDVCGRYMVAPAETFAGGSVLIRFR
jgi:hypothetical protein